MKTLWKMPAALLALSILLLTGCSAARPLHRSHASIRASLLQRTPAGISKEQVETFIAKEGWRVLPDQGIDFLPRAAQQGGGPAVTKEVQSVIMAEFGGYFILTGTRYVYGLWGFDSNNRLVDLWVYKERDSL